MFYNFFFFLSAAGKSGGSNNPVVVNSITKLQTLMVDGKVLVQGGKVRESGGSVSDKLVTDVERPLGGAKECSVL